MDVVEGIEIGGGVERIGLFLEILSPRLASLPGISLNFFSLPLSSSPLFPPPSPPPLPPPLPN